VVAAEESAHVRHGSSGLTAHEGRVSSYVKRLCVFSSDGGCSSQPGGYKPFAAKRKGSRALLKLDREDEFLTRMFLAVCRALSVSLSMRVFGYWTFVYCFLKDMFGYWMFVYCFLRDMFGYWMFVFASSKTCLDTGCSCLLPHGHVWILDVRV
jgi:hypothetical protein